MCSGFYANSGVIGRSVIAPPALSADRVEMLRSAFAATLKDPDFLHDISTTRLELEPMSGAELQAIVAASAKVSPAGLARARAAREE